MPTHPKDHDHKKDPHLWFRPSERLSKGALVALLECGTITATPRLGVRDAAHPKGYYPGQTVTVRVFDEKDEVRFERWARITKVIPRTLNMLTAEDLFHARPYDSWEDVFKEFSRFENRELSPNEEVTIVHFKL